MSKKTAVSIGVICAAGIGFAIVQAAMLLAGQVEAARIWGIISMAIVAMIMFGASAAQLYIMNVRERYFRARDAEMDMPHQQMVDELDRMQTIRERWVQDNRRPWQMP